MGVDSCYIWRARECFRTEEGKALKAARGIPEGYEGVGNVILGYGKSDFIAKLQIALKEANETGYWLELLYKTDYITEKEFKDLGSACTGVRVMLISSINTAKANK